MRAKQIYVVGAFVAVGIFLIANSSMFAKPLDPSPPSAPAGATFRTDGVQSTSEPLARFIKEAHAKSPSSPIEGALNNQLRKLYPPMTTTATAFREEMARLRWYGSELSEWNTTLKAPYWWRAGPGQDPKRRSENLAVLAFQVAYPSCERRTNRWYQIAVLWDEEVGRPKNVRTVVWNNWTCGKTG